MIRVAMRPIGIDELLRLSAVVGMLLASSSGIATGQDTVGTASVRGVVQRHDGTPGAGLRVCIADTNQCAVSDGEGRFGTLDARPGTRRLEVQLELGVVLATREVETRAGLTSEVQLVLPEVGAVETSITVNASAVTTPDEVVTSGVRIRNREIAKVADGMQDVSRYVATLPGVMTGSADFRNDIIVRGGSPLENLFIVDNIEIPNINSFANLASAGGTFSLLDVQLIEDVTFLTGGYPAPYVNRLSSVMQVTQREGSREKFRGRATVAYAGAGGVLEGPWGGGNGSWIVSGRRSFLDLFSNNLGTGGVPVYYSFTGKAVRDFGSLDRVWVTSITGLDTVRLGPSDDLDPADELNTVDIRYSGFRNATGFNWQHIFGSRGVGLLGLTHSRARVDSTVKDLVRNGPFAPGADIEQRLAAGAVAFRQDATEDETTLKYDLTLHGNRFGEFRLGATQKRFVNNYITLSPLGYDGPYTRVPDINPINLRERITAAQSGAYLQGTHTLAPRVRLTLGGRFDRYAHFGKAHTRFSPRAALRVGLGGNLSWNSSWGLYHQLPLYLFMSAFESNRALRPARSEHWVTGISWIPRPSLRVTVEAYAKNYKDYPASTQFPQLSFANVGDTFNVRDILYPMSSVGRGRSRGVEFFVEKKSEQNWFGQLNFAYSRTYHAGRDHVFRPGAFDRPFAFNAVGGRRLAANWELAMRTSYLTGRPYTPFHGELSRAQQRGIFDLDRVNALRLPAFFTLDLRVDRIFRVGDQTAVVYAGMQNVTGRKNRTAASWNRLTNEAGPSDAVGRFLIMGMEWAF